MQHTVRQLMVLIHSPAVAAEAASTLAALEALEAAVSLAAVALQGRAGSCSMVPGPERRHKVKVTTIVTA